MRDYVEFEYTIRTVFVYSEVSISVLFVWVKGMWYTAIGASQLISNLIGGEAFKQILGCASDEVSNDYSSVDQAERIAKKIEEAYLIANL